MVIFGGRQKLLAARRAGGCGPRPQRSCQGSAGGEGRRRGLRASATEQPAPRGETRSQRLCQPPGPGRRRPVAPCPLGIHEPRPASGPGRRLETDKASRLLCRKVQGPASSGLEGRGLRPVLPQSAHPRRTPHAPRSPGRLRGAPFPAGSLGSLVVPGLMHALCGRKNTPLGGATLEGQRRPKRRPEASPPPPPASTPASYSLK